MLFIFDMGGVVTSTFQMDSIYSYLNLSKEDFFKVCQIRDYNIWTELETGKISTNKFWDEFNRQIGQLQRESLYGFSKDIDLQKVPVVNNDLFRLFFHPQLNEKTVELIKELRKKHRVICGTNTIQSHWENHMERGDYTFFDQTYASNKIGISKPDPDFFRLILQAENYDPKDTFFVDDKKENCVAAASVGINTHLMKNPDSLYDEWIKFTK